MTSSLTGSQAQALRSRITALEAENHRLRESEANFRTLFELSSEGIYYTEVEPPCPIHLSVDEQCEWLYQSIRVAKANPAFAAMYGVDNSDELIGLTNSDVHVEDSDKNAAFIRGIVINGYRCRNSETEEVDQLGRPRYFLNNGVGIVENGYVVGYWSTQTDITELRQTQQALLAAERAKSRELEHLNAELRQTLTELEGRDRISDATAAATNALLTITPLDTAINVALKTIGEALETDRVCVLENFKPVPDSAFPSWRHSEYEWTSAGTVPQQTDLAAFQGSYEDIQWLYELFQQGRSASYLIEDAPEPFRSAQLAIGVKSTCVVPILVDGQWWGVLGLDDCLIAKQRTAAEISILKVAADCIGSAIQRERNQQSLQQAEQAQAVEQARNEVLTQRDILLNASATSVSALLTVEDLDEAINLALKTIGEALDTDRAAIVEFFYPDSETSLPHWRGLYEWDAPDIPVQIADPATAEGTHEGIEALLFSLIQGEITSIPLEAMEEPFRSQMATLGVKVMHSVPIFVEGEIWGALSFDDCGTAISRSPSELSLLRVAADCIGSAIARQRVQQTLRQTEQARAVEQARNEVLQQRDRMLTTVAEATKDLLDTSNTDLEQVIPEALQVLGEGLGCDRVDVLENFGHSLTEFPDYQTVIYEWAAPDVVPQISHSEAAQVTCEGLSRAFVEQYLENDGFGGPVDDWPEPLCNTFKAVDILSSYSVPIWVGEAFWGVVGFDYCREAKEFSPSEMAVLRTAAACIGGAIQRDRAQKAALQAEQTRAQELEHLNTELQQALSCLSDSEERYRTLFEISSEGIYRCEFEQPIAIDLSIDEQVELMYRYLQVAEANATYAAMYGFDNPKEAIGMRLTDAHLLESEQNRNMMRSVVENGYRLRNAETEEVDRDGNPRYFLNNITTLVEDGYAVGGWASQLDITELRLAEQALLKAEQDRVAKLIRTNQILKNSLDRLATELNLDAFLGHVLTEISQQLNIHTSCLQLYDPSTETLQLRQWVDQGTIRQPESFSDLGPMSQPIAAKDTAIWKLLLHTRRPFIITLENAAHYMFPGTDDWQLQWAEQHGIQAGINILLILGDTPLGLLFLLSAERSEFTPEELEHVQAISQQATLAIQLTRLADEAKQTVLIDERNRLARDIHDTLAQSLGGIILQLQAAESAYTTNLQDKQAHLSQALLLAKQALTEARRSVQALRPSLLEQTTLDQAIEALLQQLTSGSDVQATYQVHGSPYQLPPAVEAHLLRISQEAITNALRYAQASELGMSLTYEPRQVQLRIQDNGNGFDPTQTTFGYGLIGMRERAQQITAHLQLNSQPGQGTIVLVTLPTSTATAKDLHD
ncbi:MAG: GAF domain-containing protein [Cyanobacteria bacterium P01_A01_bin.15]